jgi:predicted ATPase/DNA-binding SARP family transcriptional activator
VEFAILGPTVLRDGAREVALGGSRRGALLALLALHANRPVATEQLVQELWDGNPPGGATATLHSHISGLRRVVGVERLRTRAGGYELVVAGDELDATLFEAEMAAGRTALARGDARAAAQTLGRALARWRGPALADAAGASWASAEVARLEELRAAAHESLLEARLMLGENAEVAALAEAAVAAHPLRERLWASLMRALYRGGRQADALQAYQRLRSRLSEELGIDPGEDLVALELAILQHDPSLDGPRPVGTALDAVPTNLPEVPTSFVGRDVELDRLLTRLAAARLVTVTGPGGVGKTRLALEAARRATSTYPDGVFLCDLAAVTVGSAVPDALASVLRVQQRTGRVVVERLVEFLQSKQVLLVIDNCEHVVDAVAATAEQLITRTASVNIVATSREPLAIAGEQRLPIEPLPVPLGDEDADEVASVRLFADRAAAVQPSFALDLATLPLVRELCRRVDGLPLAIELAAARLAARTLAELVHDLEDRLDTLSGGRRTDHARHRSVQALIGWSYDLLSDEERRLYEQLSVFAGGFTTNAAAAVHEVPTGVGTDLLEALVVKSLVVARPVGDTTRYRLLEPLRRDAEQRLRHRGDLDQTRRRHAGWAIGLAEAADAGLRTAAESAWVARVDADLANLRAAHHWSLTAGDADVALRLSAALYWYATSTGPSEVFGWAERASHRFAASRHPLLATVLASAGIGAWRRGDVARARDLAERAIEAARGHEPAAARLPLQVLGDVGVLEGHCDRAVECYRRAAALGHACGDPLQTVTDIGNTALALGYMGNCRDAREEAAAAAALAATTDIPTARAWAAFVAGEVRLDDAPEEAARLLQEAIDEADVAHNTFIAGVAGLSAVSVQARVGDPHEALRRYPALLDHFQRLGGWMQLWLTIRTLVETFARIGRDEEAAILYGALTTSRTATPVTGGDVARLAGALAAVEERLGSDRVRTLLTEGALLSDQQAMEYALGALRARRAS